jgi:hypothetical protein
VDQVDHVITWALDILCTGKGHTHTHHSYDSGMARLIKVCIGLHCAARPAHLPWYARRRCEHHV